ncbi:YkgB family protein [Nocardia sp. NPDC049149]|uniref:YkgB family protein n=1 Tax=Nocardia sp. NPDC049149 TaxID=3364315 RepID=UPI00371E283F
MTTKTLTPLENRATDLQSVGGAIVRYGLALVLIWIGAMKFFAFEAQGIQPLIENSPLMSWLYNFLSMTALSAVLGVIEVALGLLIASWKWVPGLSALASLGAVVMFLITLSFMLTTPGVWQPGYGFPYLGSAGGFLIKDVVLLGAAVATAGASLTSLRRA